MIGAITFPHVSCVYLWLLDLNWLPTHVAYFMKYIRIDNCFSNGGMHTITGALTTVYWCAAFIKIWNIKITKFIKLNKNISYIYLPVHRIIQLVPIVRCCFRFSAFGLNTKKNYRWYIEIVKFCIGVQQNKLQESLV